MDTSPEQDNGKPLAKEKPHWWIYQGSGEPHDGMDGLPPPPPWRAFTGEPLVHPQLSEDEAVSRRLGLVTRGLGYRPDDEVVEMVNAALYLRRPLLITGKPGTGKSTLAYSIAHELQLGPVLYWPINTQSTLHEGLYDYDAIGRLQEANLHQASSLSRTQFTPDIGRFIQLGPLGTALLPQARPRVLLIDELDKSDIDLPNDLLNVFEEGRYLISELSRLPEDQSVVEVMVSSGTDRVPVRRGHVQCHAFPVIVITSNGEREFPPAFLRRCMRLDIKPPDHDQLVSIVAAQLGEEETRHSIDLIERFIERRDQGDIATDQLLNAIYLATSGARLPGQGWERLENALLRSLESAEQP
ncbi:MoxR family ATPase [Nonomuraea sp. FMUSA5-5]|uniref:MoxR family ATPase n=1 Tax=Nonomuraea composti TaxID=2720023 RepID=A0ABX1ATL8_9ACTN|nr:MoxR family ATPase [Nonomuraea sp. FMUSA5-5]NJP88958.1 MoxR family ATPase [Nonomuraea sp. FMUSA5-5]